MTGVAQAYQHLLTIYCLLFSSLPAVWSSGPGHSAWVDSKTKMTATSCSNSDNSKNIVVSLSEDDIPGAKLPWEIPEQCIVQQLKQWLSCRSACVSGKKPQLIARIKDYIKSGPAIKHLRDPDGGIHLARKKAQLGVIEEVKPDVKTSFPTEGFSDSLDSTPSITFKAVWTYMVACVEAKRQLSTAKPLVKGFNSLLVSTQVNWNDYNISDYFMG